MKKHSESSQDPQEVRRKLIGLGEKSLRKSYYPELRVRLAELERFRALLDQSNDAIILMDAEGLGVVDANETAAALLGRSKAELAEAGLGRLIEFDGQQSWSDLFEEAGMSDDGGIEGICHFSGPGGTRHPVEYTAKVVVFAGEKYLVFAGRDISERLKAEKEKEALQSQLIQAQKMEALGTLAGGIAHDFNNILAGILGYTELALMEARNGRATPNELEEVIKFTGRAQELIRQIMTFSRKMDFALRPIDLNQVIVETVPLLEHTIPKMISVQVSLAQNLPLVDGDATQIEQMLLNLASNAKDAMPEGGKLILETELATITQEDADHRLDADPGEFVLMSVSDTGRGMDKATVSHIFEPFYTTKEVGKGTGLGLASAFGIVKSHGGRIECYSELGHGTTFRIYLPALPPHDQSAAVQFEESDDVVGGTETILLVDDEAALREIGSRSLRAHGYKVITAGSGEDALARYKQGGAYIDLVIMDISMPGMGGHKCLRKILKLTPEAKVIIASGYARGMQHRDVMASGASGYIVKPFRTAELLKSVREALDA